MLEIVRQSHPVPLARVIAIVDLEGSSVGMVLAQVVHTMPLGIIAERRMRFPFTDFSEENLHARLTDIINTVGNEMLLSLRGTAHYVDTVYVILHAPWVSTRIAHRTAYEGKEAVVSRDFINTIAMNAITHDIVPKQENFLEGRVMQVELNGYPTRDPLGKNVSSVGLTLLVSESPSAIRAATKESLTGLFPLARVEWRSSTRAVTSAMRYHTSKAKNYLLFDFSDNATMLTLIKEGMPTAHTTIPFGTNSFISFLEKHHLAFDMLDSLPAQSTGRYASSVMKELNQCLFEVENMFVALLAPALGDIGARASLPHRVRMRAPQEMHPWFAHVLQRPECTIYTHDSLPFIVQPLAASSFGSVFHEEDAVQDTMLAAACALVHNELEHT